MFFCEGCRVDNDWPGFKAVSFGKCEMCGSQQPCYDVPSSALPLAMPKTVRLYAHEEHEDWNPSDFKSQGVTSKRDKNRIQALLDKKPLYEVEFEYDLSTGRCLYIYHEGSRWVPDPEEFQL